MPSPVGTTITLPFTVTDPTTGNPANAATQTVTITLPDGTTASPSVSNVTTGSYRAFYVATQAGRHTWTATTTSPATVYGPDAFNVTAVADGPIVGLAEAKVHLNKSTTDDDDELLSFCYSAADAIEAWCGQVFRRKTVTEVYDGGRIHLLLRTLPVASIVSVTEFGMTLSTGQYTLDTNAGTLSRGTTLVPIRWLPGIQNVTVTYVAQPAGSIVPTDVTQATKVMIQHLWETQRGGSNRPRQVGADSEYDPRSTYSLPRRVQELLDTHQAPGFA